MSPEAARRPTVVRSVYVHAPFCARRCSYCDFAVQVRRTGDLPAWRDALAGELAALAAEGALALADALDTLYVGGGTPSLLGPEAMAALAGLIGPERLRSSDLEWTAEANPESFTPEVARAWRSAGVNRLSLGVQSFSAEALRWMGRLHGPDGARRAVEAARGAGIDNVSVDLIFGLPEHLGRRWDDDLERAVGLDVPHVSVYGLTVEPSTPLGRAVAEGRERPVEEERYREEFLRASEFLRAAGYEHYEVSNFARPGAGARHNAVYWEGGPYLGLGNGAHSFDGSVRRWNERDWIAYHGAACGGRLPLAGSEELDAEQRALERTWLGLRTRHGVVLDPFGPKARAEVAGWEASGLASLEGERMALTPEGWLVLDRLAVELDALRSD